jgi:hypothetical protein
MIHLADLQDGKDIQFGMTRNNPIARRGCSENHRRD